MRKKLNRQRLDSLWKELTEMSEYEQTATVGGETYCFDKSGYFLGTKSGIGNYIEVNGQIKELDGSISFINPNTGHATSGNSNGSVMFTGNGISHEVFSFFSENTNVEWTYCYKDGSTGGGLLTTDHKEHQSSIPNYQYLQQKGYDSIVHNHGDGVDPHNQNAVNQAWESSLEDQESAAAAKRYNMKFYIYNEADPDGGYMRVK